MTGSMKANCTVSITIFLGSLSGCYSNAPLEEIMALRLESLTSIITEGGLDLLKNIRPGSSQYLHLAALDPHLVIHKYDTGFSRYLLMIIQDVSSRVIKG